MQGEFRITYFHKLLKYYALSICRNENPNRQCSAVVLDIFVTKMSGQSMVNGPAMLTQKNVVQRLIKTTFWFYVLCLESDLTSVIA